MKKNNLVLVVIIFVGLALRLVSLQTHPVGFTPDEASFGFDAYSLIHTGADQWGNSWPIVLKSFGDYKMPLYSYLTIPSVYIFGLNEAAVRLPSAIFGVLAIWATYLLTKEIFDKKTALIAAAMIAISPWHLPLSRGAFEANLTTFFMPFGVYLFIKGLKSSKFMLLSATIFGLNLFTYHSARLVTPLIVLTLILTNFSSLKNKYQKYVISGVVFSLFAFIGLYSLLLGSATRAATSTIFSTASNVLTDRFRSTSAGEPVLLAKVFNNKATYILDKFSDNYTSYFSPEFLFINGPREGTYGMVAGTWVLYPIEVLFFITLLVLYIKKKIKIPAWLCVWLILAPIPAAISVGPGLAANRAAIMMPAIQIVSALGAYSFYELLSKKLSPQKAMSILVVSFILCFAVFLENYWYAQPAKEAKAMIYGSHQVFSQIADIQGQYDQIIITKKLSEPHIFAAFYNKIDPLEYQVATKSWNFEDKGLSWVDQMPAYALGKFIFKNIDWVADMKGTKTLIVAPTEEVPENSNVISEIDLPDGTPLYSLVSNKTTEFAQK